MFQAEVGAASKASTAEVIGVSAGGDPVTVTVTVAHWTEVTSARLSRGLAEASAAHKAARATVVDFILAEKLIY